jgi:hypothetical protein
LWVFIPVLFALGIPIVNIRGSIKQKIAQIFVISIISMALFFGSVLAMLTPGMDKYIFPGIITGMAGVGFLGINGLLIENIKVNYKSILITFLLSGFSMPFWVFTTENVLPEISMGSDSIRQIGVMTLWMIMTTIGISTGIKTKKATASTT